MAITKKTVTEKKPAAKKAVLKKAVLKKAVVKKTTAKKVATKKPVTKKTTAKKVATKKPVVKKTTAKKVATKKPAVKKTVFKPEMVGNDSHENLKAASSDIDRQMKKLSNLDSRVLIARDQLEEFQSLLQKRRMVFQEKNTAAAKRAYENARKKITNHKDLLSSLKETRAEVAKMLKDSKTIHKAYESVVSHLNKAEIAFMKKLHRVEKQMLVKAERLKRKILD